MKNLALKHPILGSSADYTKVSLTIKGILMGVITLLVAFGVNAEALELPRMVEIITDLIVQVGTIISGGTVLVGLIRKAINYYK